MVCWHGDLTHNYDAELGLPNPFGVGGWPGLYSAGFDNVGNGFEWETQNTNAANQFYGVLDDNGTKVKGKHEFQFGFHYRFVSWTSCPRSSKSRVTTALPPTLRRSMIRARPAPTRSRFPTPGTTWQISI